MTQTPTDYLFKLTAPPTDRAYGPAGPSSGADNFDNHLSQASVRGDDSRSVRGSVSRTETSRYQESPPERDPYRDDTQQAPTAPASTESSRQEGNTSSQDSAEQADSPDRVEPGEAEDVDHQRDDDKSEDATDAAAGGQVACDTPQQASVKSDGDADGKSKLTAKAKTLAAVTTDGAAQKATAVSTKTITDGNEQVVVEGGLPTDAVEPFDGETAVVGTPTGEGESSEEAVLVENKPKFEKAGRSRGKQTLEVSEHNEKSASTESANAEKNVDLPPIEASLSAGCEEASQVASDKLSAEDRSDGEPTTDDAHGKTKRDARADSTAPASKVDAAQLANAAASAANVGANNSSKSENEQSIKPVAQKGEPAAAALDRLTRSNAGANRSDSTSETNEGPRVDPSRFVARVAKAFHTAQDRGGTLQLRLNPSELGALHLELTVKDGVMSASMQTETASARRLLLDHLPALRDRLAEQNIRIDRFDVDVRRDGSESQADTRGSRHQQFQQPSEQPTPRRGSSTQRARSFSRNRNRESVCKQ